MYSFITLIVSTNYDSILLVIVKNRIIVIIIHYCKANTVLSTLPEYKAVR